MVVPFPPGAASDFLACVLGQKLSDTWGQQIVVDIHYYLFPLPAVMPVLREGKIRPIATGGRTRAVALFQVPTTRSRKE